MAVGICGLPKGAPSQVRPKVRIPLALLQKSTRAGSLNGSRCERRSKIRPAAFSMFAQTRNGLGRTRWEPSAAVIVRQQSILIGAKPSIRRLNASSRPWSSRKCSHGPNFRPRKKLSPTARVASAPLIRRSRRGWQAMIAYGITSDRGGNGAIAKTCQSKSHRKRNHEGFRFLRAVVACVAEPSPSSRRRETPVSARRWLR
jgi:hypothetical protein